MLEAVEAREEGVREERRRTKLAARVAQAGSPPPHTRQGAWGWM